jgi:hypothetical protein
MNRRSVFIMLNIRFTTSLLAEVSLELCTTQFGSKHKQS